MLNSCKKANSEASDSKLIALKQWYQNNIGLKSNSDFKDLEPIWETAYINNQDKFIVYEISLSRPDALVLPFSSLNIKEEAAILNVNKVELIPFRAGSRCILWLFLALKGIATDLPYRI